MRGNHSRDGEGTVNEMERWGCGKNTLEREITASGSALFHETLAAPQQ